MANTRPTQGGSALPVTIVGYEASGITANAAQVEQITYSTPKTGELAGSATAAAMPDISCKLVKFKALADNAGSVYIGVAGVTIPNGTTDSTSGWPLAAGEETGWIPVDNLNRFYRICTNAGDDLSYLALE